MRFVETVATFSCALTKMAFEDGGNGAAGIAYDLYYPEPGSKVKNDFFAWSRARSANL